MLSKITIKFLLNICKINKILFICIFYGLISTILFYLAFKDILWMGIFCFFIGVIGLYKKIISSK